MTDENKPLEEGTPPQPNDRMAKARAAKAAKRSQKPQVSVDATALIIDLQRQLTELKAERNAETADVEVTTATPGAPHRPGEYVQVGPPDRPNAHKVRWSRDDMERYFTWIEFTPEVGMTVGGFGWKADLIRRVPVRVPSFVKDLHDAEVNRLEHSNDRYRPVTLAEHADAAQRAMENPGVPVWTRLAIMPGGGLFMGETTEAETAQTA